LQDTASQQAADALMEGRQKSGRSHGTPNKLPTSAQCWLARLSSLGQPACEDQPWTARSTISHCPSTDLGSTIIALAHAGMSAHARAHAYALQRGTVPFLSPRIALPHLKHLPKPIDLDLIAITRNRIGPCGDVFKRGFGYPERPPDHAKG
jgi:hypothetical protein